MTSLADFLSTHGEAISRAVLRAYPPIYSARNRDGWGIDLTRLSRRPLGAQGDAIRALTVSMRRDRGTNLVGEMGTGKTTVAAAAAYLAGFRRIIVLCPPHLTRKWKREIEMTVPLAAAVIVTTISDVERLPPPGRTPLFVVLSRERAKLSYRWKPAVVSRLVTSGRRVLYDEDGAPLRRLCCPRCYQPVLDDEGLPFSHESGRTAPATQTQPNRRTTMTTKTKTETVTESATVFIPLNKLKKSPHNARRTSHPEAAIEALAASIHAKGMLQNLVVEPERDAEGTETGCYFVTAGEGRRLAQLLRARRRQIKKTEPIRCIVDTTNDPLEISLDENVTRTQMHPADQFEAFRRLSEERGWGAEEIAARFGVTPNIVRQRLRLAAVSPRLMQLYRDGELMLDQLMAFAIREDHARQEQVYDNLGWNKEPRAIRHYMMETHVPPDDRRAIFVGVDAYAEAGGTVVRDLFTEEDRGYFEGAALLDRLALEKLTTVANEVQAEGWKWAEAYLDFPHGHGLRRAYPWPVELSEEVKARLDALQAEYDTLLEAYDGEADAPDDAAVVLEDLEAQIERLSEGRYAYDADTVARGGAYVSLDRDGTPRVERGFIRPEDEPRSELEAEQQGGSDRESATAGDGDDSSSASANNEEREPARPLSDALVRDLTAHRTLGLRLALGEQPDVALVAVTHALASQSFYRAHEGMTCLEIRPTTSPLSGHADGIEDTPAAEALAERHQAWAVQMPHDVADLWAFIVTLDREHRLSLLAHCAALTVFAVRQRSNDWRGARAAADKLADAVSLDMTAHWAATARNYLGRVTRAQIVEAVREGVSGEAAEQIGSMKKQPMAEAAERLLAGTGWLPVLLRTAETGNANAGRSGASAA